MKEGLVGVPVVAEKSCSPLSACPLVALISSTFTTVFNSPQPCWVPWLVFGVLAAHVVSTPGQPEEARGVLTRSSEAAGPGEAAPQWGPGLPGSGAPGRHLEALG